MPDTLTPNYDFVLPEISGSPETWGNKLNSNFAALDSFLRQLRGYTENSEPIGLIKMWAGTIAAIPANHALCDGTIQNEIQTPDLRERFIVGGKTGSTLFEPGDFGGAIDHNHGGNSGGTILTVAQLPAHKHATTVTTPIRRVTGSSFLSFGTSFGDMSSTDSWGGTVNMSDTGSDNPHSHSITAAANLPPYYTLAFIMRVSYPWT